MAKSIIDYIQYPSILTISLEAQKVAHNNSVASAD
jgi:hypothetical protein